MDAHAYVDECLSREDRIAFEARLRDDPELRRQVDLWQAQNDAIRAAFRAPPRARGPLSVGRPFNENVSRAGDQFAARGGCRDIERCARPFTANLAGERAANSRLDQPWRAGSGRGRYGRLWSCRCRRFCWRSAPRAARRTSAARSSARGLPRFVHSAPIPASRSTFPRPMARALARQLSPRFVARAAAANFDVAGWTLIGARFVPGTASAAAFVLWENRDRARMGLLIEPLDAPASSTPRNRDFGGVAISAWTEGGKGFAAVGPDMNAVVALIGIGGLYPASSFAAR